MSITRCAVRHWRITATADRAAPEPFYPVVACRGATSRSAPATPSSLRRLCGGSPGGRWVGDLFRREERSGSIGSEGAASAVAAESPLAYGPVGDRHDSERSFGDRRYAPVEHALAKLAWFSEDPLFDTAPLSMAQRGSAPLTTRGLPLAQTTPKVWLRRQI